MSINSDVSTVSRRRFLAAAGSMAAASSFAVGKDVGSPQTSPGVVPVHYLVTIHVDVTSGSISYCAQNTDTGQDVPMPNNDLTVNMGDEVKWQADTGPHGKHRANVRFTKTSPFSKSEFKWSENQTGGGRITTLITDTYYYCVGVFDVNRQEIYADDPRIIVGGTFDAKAEIEEARRELREVKEKITSIDGVLSQAIDKL